MTVLGDVIMRVSLKVYAACLLMLAAGWARGVECHALEVPWVPNVQAGLPIHVHADRSGYVTLVVEDSSGNRIQNIAFDQPVSPGDNVLHWDGSSLTGVAKAGNYHVRGLFHEAITPKLQYFIYSPGTPPWPNASGTGAWLADHTAPASALFLPQGSPWPTKSSQPEVLLGADSAEAGHALMWMDLDGHKLAGTKIRGWNGGIALARDIGPHPNPNNVAYTVYVVNPSRDFGVKDPGALQVYALTKSSMTPLNKVVGGVQVHDAFRELVSLAAYNGLLLLANPAANEIVAFDVRTDRQDSFFKIHMPGLGAIAFEPDGHLLVSTNGAIVRFTVEHDWKTVHLIDQHIVVPASELEAPKQILASDGEIYVSDWGLCHQVKVFGARDGQLKRLIGRPGGPQIGNYDELRMAHPMGMAIDSNGVLWVAEEDYLPKRISRWNAHTGKFLNAWYGPTQYGGGGFIDPHDPSTAYYPSLGNPGSMGLLEFHIDLKTGDSRLTAVRYRYPDPSKDLISYGGYAPHPIFFPDDMIPAGSHGGIAPGETFYFKGKQYFTDSYNTYWYNQTQTTTLWLLENGVCRPIASAGWVSSGPHHWATLDVPGIQEKIPAGDRNSIFFVWEDRNHDHAVQADEVSFHRAPSPGAPGVVIQPDLSILAGGPYYLSAESVDQNGIPEYNLTKLKSLSDQSAKGEMALSPDGWLIADLSGYKDGHKRWTLSSRDISMPPQGPGDIENPERMLGYPVKPAHGEAGYMVARYSYMGEIYIFTTDGLLVTTLGADGRLAPSWPYESAKIGMSITNLSFEAEQFWPFMFGDEQGNVYLSVGKWHTSVVRLEGLKTVRRIDLGAVMLSKKDIAAAEPIRAKRLAENVLRDKVNVVSVSKYLSNGFAAWDDKAWVPINQQISFQIGRDANYLVLGYRTGNPELLRNSAAEFPFAFTQGGGLDLMIRTGGDPASNNVLKGDMRLFVTRRNGRTLAVLYKQVNEGVGHAQVFASPVGEVKFDDVEDVSDAVQLLASGGNYQIKVPLSVFGIAAPSGNTVRGDVGVVLGDGARARARIYWHNKWDSMAADVPSEARLNPARWGRFSF